MYEAYERIELGDKTLSIRVKRTIEMLGKYPDLSISVACRDPHQAKAVYRLIGNEKFQEDTAQKLINLISIYSIIAIQILTLLSRSVPEKSCEVCFSEQEWQILYKVVNKTKVLPEKIPTINEFVIMIAKLGGFLARKNDGCPGVLVVWRGLSQFATILSASAFLS